MEIIQLPVLEDNFIYVLHNSVENKTAVVDPALAEPVLNCINGRGWHLDYILNTHHHLDHTGANLELKEATSCKIVGSKEDARRIPGIDILLQQGDTFPF